jgi:hypothetical protein
MGLRANTTADTFLADVNRVQNQKFGPLSLVHTFCHAGDSHKERPHKAEFRHVFGFVLENKSKIRQSLGVEI